MFWKVEEVKELKEKIAKMVEDFFDGMLKEDEDAIKCKKSDGKSCSHYQQKKRRSSAKV